VFTGFFIHGFMVFVLQDPVKQKKAVKTDLVFTASSAIQTEAL